MEKHKFSVLEIQEYYETYCMRKDLAEQVNKRKMGKRTIGGRLCIVLLLAEEF